MTFAQSSLKALGWSWKFNSHWTRKARSVFASVPSKVSGSRRRLVSSARVASQQTNRTREIVKDDEGGVCVGWEVVVIEVVIVEVGVGRIVPRIITGATGSRPVKGFS